MTDVVLKVAWKVAHSFARTYASAGLREDLLQEAAVLALEHKHKPPQYVHVVCRGTLMRRVWQMCSPVSGSTTAQCGPIPSSVDIAEQGTEHVHMGTAEVLLGHARAQAALRQHVLACEGGELAVQVLLEEKKPREVARAYKLPVETVYRATSAVLSQLRNAPPKARKSLQAIAEQLAC